MRKPLRLTLQDSFDIAFCGLVWLLFCLSHGYTFAELDQIELIPYARYLQDTQLYAKDFFVQSLHATQPNVRWALAWLLSKFGSHLALGSLWLHFTTISLSALGMIKLARELSKGIWPYLWVLPAMVWLLGMPPGGNAIASAAFQADMPAHALLIWAWWAWIRYKKAWPAYLLLSCATFLHPLVGIQGFLLTVAGHLLWARSASSKQLWAPILYLMTAGIFFVLILQANQSQVAGFGSEEFYKIYLELRHPHHYLPQHFAAKSMWLVGLLGVLAAVVFWRSQPLLAGVALCSLLGCLAYAVGVSGLQSVLVAKSQWFKTTIHLMNLGLLALLMLPAQFLRVGERLATRASVGLIWTLLITSLLWIRLPGSTFPRQRSIHFTRKHQDSELISILQAAKDVIPQDALFVQPMAITQLKAHAERSSYVDYKAMVHHAAYLQEWYARLGQVYGLSTDWPEKSFYLIPRADKAFHQMSFRDKEWLKSRGVTHALFRAQEAPGWAKPAIQNSRYLIARL